MASRAAFQNQVIRGLMALMDGHREPHLARYAWKHILHQLNQGPNPLKDRNRFMEQDGVVQYVNTMLAVENYWSCVSRQKVAILGRLIYYMQVGSAGARAVSAQMGPRMEAAVEHELWSWIYFHERIIEVLDVYIMQAIASQNEGH